MFGVRPAGHHGDDQRLGVRPDPLGLTLQALQRPVCTWHVLRLGAMARTAVTPQMGGNALAAMEDLDRPRGGPGVHLLTDQAVLPRFGNRRLWHAARCLSTLVHGVALRCGFRHPEPTGSRRATPPGKFQQTPGHPPDASHHQRRSRTGGSGHEDRRHRALAEHRTQSRRATIGAGTTITDTAASYIGPIPSRQWRIQFTAETGVRRAGHQLLDPGA